MGSIVSREPVVWWIVGYPFPAGPMVVCILAVIITRVVIGLQAQGRAQWALDAAITALCLLVTVLWVQSHQLELLPAGMIGFAKSAVIGRAKAALDAFLGTAPKS